MRWHVVVVALLPENYSETSVRNTRVALMNLPTLTKESIRRMVPSIQGLEEPLHGGQKIVYPCVIEGSRYALKAMLVECGDFEDVPQVTARARREIGILQSCQTPYLVKLGPVPLTQATVDAQEILYFTEEWIEGEDLQSLIEKGYLLIGEVTRLGENVANAIQALWDLATVHRDIKPANIMRRNADGTFIVLDMGLALDLQDASLTTPGKVAGTVLYLSPEQTEFSKKRQLDFRSDLFALGIVLYQALTSQHPFWTQGMGSQQAIGAMLNSAPRPPSELRHDIPADLDEIVLRLLAKRPHQRYRKCEDLIDALRRVQPPS